MVTISIERGLETITVELVPTGRAWMPQKWRVTAAIDEFGNSVVLTPEERATAVALASAGVDETGR